jgi:very-short-patch-repair endonuclease
LHSSLLFIGGIEGGGKIYSSPFIMKIIHNLNDLKFNRRELRKNATPEERMLWYRVRSKKIGYRFHRQHSIGPYIVDFYCPQKRLIIEIDGNQHNENCTRFYDTERTKFLEGLGYKVMRFYNEEVRSNIEGVLSLIKIHLTP